MSSTDNRARVLIIDDDDDFLYALGNILSKCQCEVYKADSYETAIQLLEEHTIDITFCDLRLPGSLPGKEILIELNQAYPDIHFIMMSAHVDDETLCELLDLGATDVIQKPFYRDYCDLLITNTMAINDQRWAA